MHYKDLPKSYAYGSGCSCKSCRHDQKDKMINRLVDKKHRRREKFIIEEQSQGDGNWDIDW